jgi:hypothetical protein
MSKTSEISNDKRNKTEEVKFIKEKIRGVEDGNESERKGQGKRWHEERMRERNDE